MSWVIWGVLFLAAAWIVWTYNGLVALRHQIQNAWKQMEVQLKRRYDLIPNLVETVKGYMKYEQETLQSVIDARIKANENVLGLQEELTTTENQIAFARQYYNDLVMRFNMKQEVFPSNMIAGFFHFQPGEFFSVP